MPEYNDPQQNTLRPDNKPAKKGKTEIVKDVISKGRTATGNKPDEIILNPVLEAKEKKAVFAFGRFNPPTIGHEKLIHKVEDTAKSQGAEAHIIASHTEGNAKNPLPKEKKVEYLKKIAGEGTNVSSSSSEHPTLLHHLSRLHKSGIQHITMVAGDDRVKEYHSLINKYNGKKGPHGLFNFKTVSVVSAGHRDPDAEGAEGMSGTKMREHARSGNMIAFKSGLPKALHPHAKEMMDHIKSIKEDVDNEFDSFIMEAMLEEIGSIYDQVMAEENINYDETKFREDGSDTVVTLSKHVTPGEPKSSKVVGKNTAPAPAKTTKPNVSVKEATDSEFNKRFGKYREAVPRSGQDRKEIDLVPRDDADRKESDKPYRQQSVVKKILDDDFEMTFGKGPPSNMSSPSNDLKKQQVKLPKATMPDFKSKSTAKLPNVNDYTPDMFKSEAYGKGYKSPAQKIADAARRMGKPDPLKGMSDAAERLKQNSADYQAILDREAKEKEKKNESVNSAGVGGVRGMGYTSGNPDGESGEYVDKNIADADTRDNIIKALVKSHVGMHTNNSDAMDTPDSDTQDQIMNQKKKNEELVVSEDLRKWFKDKWVRMDTKGNIKGPCAREEGEGKPKCLPMAKAKAMDKEDRAAATRRKRREDPVADRSGKGESPVFVKTEATNWAQQAAIAIAMQKAKKKPKNEETEIKEVSTQLIVRAAKSSLDQSEISREKANQKVKDLNKITDPDSNKIIKGKEKEADDLSKDINDLRKHSEVKNKQAKFFARVASRRQVKEDIEQLEEKNTPTNPSLWSKAKALAKSKFDVYPSAYANGWAAKWYKSKGGGWKSTNEEVVNEISDELVGKVNKLRSLGPDIIKGVKPTPHKTSAGAMTLNKAVEKVRNKSEVGKVKDK
jgi:hypothetical protein